MLKRYMGGLTVAAGVLALAAPAGAVGPPNVVTNPATGQSIVQPGDGTQSSTQPSANQNQAQTPGNQTVTQPTQGGEQRITQSPGSQTVSQPGQCIQQQPSGQGASQGSQNIAQPNSASCPPGSSVVPGTGPTAPTAPVAAPGTTPTGPGASTTPGGKGPGHNNPGNPGQNGPALSGGGAKHLAFTGFDVWKLMLLGGLSLAGAGGLRRFTRRSISS